MVWPIGREQRFYGQMNTTYGIALLLLPPLVIFFKHGPGAG
jgi:hypothetical protein